MSQLKRHLPTSKDDVHRFANLIVGLNIPRAWLRKLTKNQLTKVVKYVNYIWAAVNDNNVRKVERPSFMPKKYIWHDKWYSNHKRFLKRTKIKTNEL